MDDINLLQECVVKVEEIKEEPCATSENMQQDMLGKYIDEVSAPVAVLLQPKVEMEATEEQEVKTEYITSESPMSVQNDSDEEELKPVAAVYLKMEMEMDEETEKQVEKKTKLRFSVEEDLNLLKEILVCNPYANKIKWKEVHSNFMKVARKPFSLRAVKEHVDYLLNLYIKRDRSNLKESGTEEQYGEREQLLEEVNSLRREFNKSSKRKEGSQKGIKARRLAAEALENDNGESCNMEVWEFPEAILEPEENACQNMEIMEIQQLEEIQESGNHSNCEFSSTCHVPSPSSHCQKRQVSNKSITNILRERKQKDWDLESRKLDIEQQKVDIEVQKIELKRREIELEERRSARVQQIFERQFAREEQARVSIDQHTKLLEKIINSIIKN